MKGALPIEVDSKIIPEENGLGILPPRPFMLLDIKNLWDSRGAEQGGSP